MIWDMWKQGFAAWEQATAQYMEKARDLCERTGLDPEALLLLPFLS